MSSIFGWKNRWWSSAGLVDWTTDDAVVSPNGGFGPWGIDNKPIETGKWTFEFTYTASEATQINTFHTKLPEAGKDTGATSVFLGTTDLPTATKGVVGVSYELDTTVPNWIPYFAVPGNAKTVTIHKVEVFKTPSKKPGENIGQMAIVGYHPDQATGGAGQLLSVESKQGDLAILIMASQFGNTAAKAPAGWNATYNSNIGGRSGYIASKWVSDPSDTKNVKWSGDTTSTARERAALIVLRNVGSFNIVPWTTTRIEVTKPTLYFIQSHGNSKNTEPVWDNLSIRSGSASTAASWSALLGKLVTETPTFGEHDLVQGYAAVELTPSSKQSEKTVEIHPNQEGVVRVLEVNRDETPSVMNEMPFGYKNWQEMVQNRGFVVAHRGGSASWPESSMKAYTNAVAHGAGALEVSCQKTKDGVWFLNHDRTLKRVDSTAPDTAVTEMTWAEVNKYKTQGEPFLKVSDYFDAYGSSHVTVLDPKYSATDWQELKQFLPSDAKDRIIWKFSVDATWLANQWKSEGWQCWGYSYEDHVTGGQIFTWHSPWTYLGMSYDASEATWNKILTIGKSVWAHICPSLQAYNQGRARGAAGCMVSAVAEVLPLSKV